MAQLKCSAGLTLVEVVILILIVVVIAAIAIPGILSSSRCANERNASSMLKVLAVSEIDFRSNDRDGNHVNDFWTGDVAGLYCLVPHTYDFAKGAFVAGNMLKLISPPLAGAETFTQPRGALFGSVDRDFWYEVDHSKLPSRGPREGYWYYALDGDNSSGAVDDYQVITDGAAGALVHNTKRFGFGAFPDSSSKHRSLFMINESATIIRAPLPATYRRPNPSQIPPAARPVGYENWPSDNDICKYSRMD